MGQQHSHSQGEEESHGHSHGGKPCHGHGEPKPEPKQHGHSHGGKPCHGHGEPKPEPKQHGHSHGGKPCHGHGQPAQQPQQHGHSHGGKPCHGHGGGAGADTHTQQRLRALQLFAQTMLIPKLPIVFEHFHKPTEVKEPLKVTSTYTIPNNVDEKMTKAEFRTYVSAFLEAMANHAGHGVVLAREIDEIFSYFESKFQGDELSQPNFIDIATMMVGRTCMVQWAVAPELMKTMGLGFMKLPTIPTQEEEAVSESTFEYVKNEVMPSLVEYIENLSKTQNDVEIVESLKKDIVDALDTDGNNVWRENVSRIPSEAIVQEFRDDSDKLNFKLLAHFVCTQFLVQMLTLQPEAVVTIVAKWGITLKLEEEQ